MSDRRNYKEKDYKFGSMLLTLREKIGLTQATVAKYVQVTDKTLQNWEAAQGYPTGPHLKKLIELFVLYHAFSTDHEQEEAIVLWQLVTQASSRRMAIFDRQWFAGLLVNSRPLLPAPPADDTHLAQEAAKISFSDTIDVSSFYGREDELARLEQWATRDRCRLITLLGMGGIGKTSLSIKLAYQVASQFSCVIWRSLRSAPSLKIFVRDCIMLLQSYLHIQADAIELAQEPITHLIELLRNYRCLLIFDNVETLLQEKTDGGHYRSGYEEYKQLFQAIADTPHQSCLILTSREKPRELGSREGHQSPVRSFKVAALEQVASQKLLEDRALYGNADAWQTLISAYSGNPLALKVVAELIRDLFGGDIAQFLVNGEVLFGDIQLLLDQQFERLSPLEREVIYWLAIEYEQVSLQQICADFAYPVHRRYILEALQALFRRSLIERGEPGAVFSLQPVVLEYVTERLAQQACVELIAGDFKLLRSHALLKAQAKDYVRFHHQQFILQPVLDRLLLHFQYPQKVEEAFVAALSEFRKMSRLEQGYGAGNILNLCIALRGDIAGLDFSHLQVWQAYLQGVVARDVSFAASDLTGSVFTETFDGILAVTFSRDGQYLAMGCVNGEIRVLSATNYQPLYTINAHLDRAWSLSFSPDGLMLASSGGSDGLVKLWNVQNGQPLHTFRGHKGTVHVISFSPDGSFLASCSVDLTIKLWSTRKDPLGQCLQTLEGHTSRIWSLSFQSQGNLLASADAAGFVKLWDLNANLCLHTLKAHSDRVLSVAFHPDGVRLASGSADTTIKLWNITNYQCLVLFSGHLAAIESLAFSPDGMLLASGSFEKHVKLWDVTNGQCLRTLQGHTSQIWSIVFHPDGKSLISSSDDGSARIWDTQRAGSGQSLKTLQGYHGRIWSLAFSPDNSLLASGSDDRTITLWDLQSAVCLSTLEAHADRVLSLTFSSDGSMLASGSDDRTVKLWRVDHQRHALQLITVLHGHKNWIRQVAFSPDGKLLASASADSSIKLWDISEPGREHCLYSLTGHTIRIWCLAFSLDGSLLASGACDGSIKLWDIKAGLCLCTIQAHKGFVYSLAFSADGSLLTSVGDDQLIRQWCVSYIHSSQTTEKWSLSQNNLHKYEHQDWIWHLALSVDGRIFASGSSNSGVVKLWDAHSGQCFQMLQGPAVPMRFIIFSPDTSQLAIGGDDSSIALWSISSGQHLQTLRKDRDYERMNISSASGLTAAQRASLHALGAIID